MKIQIIISIVFLMITFLGSDSFADDHQRYHQLIEQADSYKYVNNDSALILLQEAYELTLAAYDTIRLKVLFPLIKAEIRSGDLISAIQHCKVFNKIAEENSDPQDQVKGLILAANVYLVSGLIPESLSFLKEAESLNNASDNKNPINTIDINHLTGLCYFNLGDYNQSNLYLQKAIHIGVSEAPVSILGPLLLRSHIAVNIDTVFNLLDKASEIIRNFPDIKYEQIAILNKYARIYKSIGDLVKSRSYYLQAINIAKEHSFGSDLSELYNNFAYQLMAEQNYDSIPIILDEALSISRELNNIDIEASLLDTYSDYYIEIEEFQLAIEFKNLSVQKRDEYRTKQQINKSLFLATVFETEKKELEILKQQERANRFRAIFFGTLSAFILLLGIAFYYRQKSAIRKVRLLATQREKTIETANALIEGQDTERKRLAMDLHDGLGASIGALRFKIDDLLENNPRHKEIISDLSDIGQHIRELSHRLLPTKMEEYGLTFSIQALIDSINKSGSVKINLQQNLQKRLPLKKEIQLYHLIFEMVNNAMKHSGCQHIFIQMMQHKNTLNLSVEDDGKGFAKGSAGDGLGLKNINQRVAYLGGTIEIMSELNKGTILMIETPITNND